MSNSHNTRQFAERYATPLPQLAELSKRLTARLGKGFDATNLRNMRLFYRAFPISEKASHKLSCTYYRNLLLIENPAARDWYITETELQHQIERERALLQAKQEE